VTVINDWQFLNRSKNIDLKSVIEKLRTQDADLTLS